MARPWLGTARHGVMRHGTVAAASSRAGTCRGTDGWRQGGRKEAEWEGLHGAARSPARTRERDKRLARDKVIPE